MAIVEIARAKINLTLEVLGRRDDGYHEIQSLVTFAGIGDCVTLRPGPESVRVSGPFAGSISNGNILDTALRLIKEAKPRLQLGTVELEKVLPVAAGIGGGSADAGALLRCVRRANPGHAAHALWAEVAARLGADVPVCLADAPALIRGIGERVEPLPRPQVTMPAVLVNPHRPLATAGVFGALGAGPVAPSVRADLPLPSFASLDDLVAYMRAAGNTLEGPATVLLPAVAEMKAMLEAQPGCRIAAMSGSGPTCFGIFASTGLARAAATSLRASRSDWWIAATELDGLAAL